MSPLIVENATKQFRQGDRKVDALAGVSLDVQQGQFLAVMGASGSRAKARFCISWPAWPDPIAGESSSTAKTSAPCPTGSSPSSAAARSAWSFRRSI